MKKTPVYFVAHTTMGAWQKDDLKTFEYLTTQENEYLYGFYLLDFDNSFNEQAINDKKLFFYLRSSQQFLFLERLGVLTAGFFKGKLAGLYKSLRFYSKRLPWQQLFYLSQKNSSENRFVFFLENFQVCEKYLQNTVDENFDIILYSDQNQKLAGLYLNKEIVIPENLWMQNISHLFEKLTQNYQVKIQKNLVIHFNEKDIALSLAQLEEDSKNFATEVYHRRANFVKNLLQKK